MTVPMGRRPVDKNIRCEPPGVLTPTARLVAFSLLTRSTAVAGEERKGWVVARATVAWMFARVGVHLAWRDGEPRTGAASDSPAIIWIRFVERDPDNALLEPLASAMPFAEGGVAIYVMYDRIHLVAGRCSREAPIVAHVLAHEIGHVLLGTDAHASAGVMKAHWDGHDYEAMQMKPLEFTSFDLKMIKDGMNSGKAGNADSSIEAFQ